MRNLGLCVLLILLLSGASQPAPAQAPNPTNSLIGMSEEDAIWTLGEPRGRMRHSTGELLIYPDFMLDIVDGRIAKIKGTPKIKFPAHAPKPDMPPPVAQGTNTPGTALPALPSPNMPPGFSADFPFPLMPGMAPPASPAGTNAATTATATNAPANTSTQTTEKKEDEEPPKPLTPREKLQKEIEKAEKELAEWPTTYGKTRSKGPRRRARKRRWRLINEIIPNLKKKLAAMDAEAEEGY